MAIHIQYIITGDFMKDYDGYLKAEDYAEPRCLLCDEPYGVTPEVKSVPQNRIIEKMNDYMSRRDYDGAERHLLYWLEEAVLGHDKGGELLIRNEMVGHYRKTGEKDKAFTAINRALELIEELKFNESISGATTFVNCATAYNAFKRDEKSLPLFEKAKQIYENDPKTSPELIGGLYNNMALSYAAIKEYEKSLELYEKAIEVMGKAHHGELEQAITYLNMADVYSVFLSEDKSEAKIAELLEKAYSLLKNSDAPRDGYYAFVCEKCAPVFSFYGFFLYANDLKKISEEIYERT